jgi:Ca-activated chloride channel family protein
MNLELFHFIRPYWLLGLLPLFIILWLLIHRHLSSGNWAKVCDPELLPHILIAQNKKQQKSPFYLFAIGGLLAILALAGPTWERLPQPSFRDTSALVILFDLSRSMDATDLKPSRLVRARFKIADIIKQRQEGQTALVVYAGDAFTVTPLTDDTDTIASQLSVLNTSLMPSQGSRADIALKKAVALLEQAGLKTGNILLITDGLNETLYKNVTKKMKQYQISILGIGTPEGAPIPLENGGFLKDAQGAIVIPKLEANSLRELAQLGGGIYTTIRNDDSDIRTLATSYQSNMIKNQVNKNKLQIDTWREQGPWLLLLLLPLAALGFRRGLLPVILLLFFLPIPQQAQAWDWKSLWLTPNQQASQAFKNGDMDKSAELFENPEWKGAAQYKVGKYEQALKSLEGLEKADDWYNKGNALARLLRYQEAIEAYKKALKLNPKHKDAEYNKALIEKQQQKQQNNSKKANSDKSKKDKQNSDKSKQDKQDSDKSKQGKQDSDKLKQKNKANKEENKQVQDKSDKKPSKEVENQNPVESITTPNESEQAKEQLLRQIVDDPGGLLRRKFQYQYQQQNQQSQGEQPW